MWYPGSSRNCWKQQSDQWSMVPDTPSRIGSRITGSDEDHVLSGYLIISIKDKISVNGDESDQGFEESNVLGDKNRPTIVGPERPPLGGQEK
jgi:hypothetical protein